MRIHLLYYVAAAALSVGVVHCTASTQNDYGGLAKSSGKKAASGDDDDSTSASSGGTPDAGPAPKPDPTLAFAFNADSGVLSAKILTTVASGAKLTVNVFATQNGVPTTIDCTQGESVDLTQTTTDGKYTVAVVPTNRGAFDGRLDGSTRTAIQGCLSDASGKSIVQLQTSILNAWDLDDQQASASPRIYHGVQAYAEGCMAEMGDIPMFANGDFACDAPGMVVLPITATVNGVVTRLDETTTNWPLTNAQQQATQECDTPAWLGYDGDDIIGNARSTQCAPFTRIGQFQNSQGTRFIAVCRREAVRPLSDKTYENINFVAHNPTSGKTCWFNNHLDNTAVDGSKIPTPDATDSDWFWMNLASDQGIEGQRCPSCHDSDPWIHSPWVDQALDKSTGHTVVPRIQQDPAYTIDVKYSIFGRESFLGNVQDSQTNWQQPQFLQNVGSCGGCHRIGTGQTMQFWADRSVSLPRNDDLQDFMTSTGRSKAVQYMPADPSSLEIIDDCAQNPNGCQVADEPH